MVQIAPLRPWGFNLSTNVLAREGSTTVYVVPHRGSDGAFRNIYVQDDFDDHRLDDVWVVDLRLEKQFAINESTNLTFDIDAFNVANRSTELSRENELSSSRAFFLNDSLSPRIYRVGVRLSWK